MKKIAVKVKLPDSSKATLPLKQAGKRLGEEFQEFDRVFLPIGFQSTYGDAKKSPKLVIRTTTIRGKDTYQLIFKRLVGDQTILFFQTQIFDYAQMSHIVAHIGYEFYGQVDKRRQQILSGDTLISLDYLAGSKADEPRQYYLKVEQILADEAPVDLQALQAVLASLDLEHLSKAGEYIEIERTRK